MTNEKPRAFYKCGTEALPMDMVTFCGAGEWVREVLPNNQLRLQPFPGVVDATQCKFRQRDGEHRSQ